MLIEQTGGEMNDLNPSRGILASVSLGSLLWVILALLLLFSSNPANAQRLSFGAGYTQFHTTDGIWWDSLSGPYQNRLYQPTFLLSLDVPGWRASLVSLGKAANNASWGDHEHSDELANPSLPRDSKYRGNGSGSIWGLSVGKTLGTQVMGWNLDAEAGLFLYRASWSEYVYELHSSALVLADQTSNTNLSGYLGATARYKQFFVTTRYYGHVLGGMVTGHANQVAMGISVPFGGDK